MMRQGECTYVHRSYSRSPHATTDIANSGTCSDCLHFHLFQEEQAREDAKTLAVLEEQARTELERRQNQAAGQIQRVLKQYVMRQIANRGKKGKKGSGKGKGGKKGKK